MTFTVLTSAGIQLLTPDTLINAVKTIENKLPGWWWSISQKRRRIYVSFGPGQNCPNPLDVAWSKTRLGDAGIVSSFYLAETQDEKEFLDWLNDRIAEVEPHRAHMRRDNPDLPDLNPQAVYRSQNARALIELRDWYQSLMKEIPFIEKEKHIFDNVYVGSCDLSADCSLRGRRDDGSEFDISVDLIGKEDTIAQSIEWSINELKNDIITHKSFKVE